MGCRSVHMMKSCLPDDTSAKMLTVSRALITPDSEVDSETSCESQDLKAMQYKLKVQQHELKVQQHELKVQQHELKVQQHESDEVILHEPVNDDTRPADIFIKPVENLILTDLCDKICLKKKNYYVIDKNSYKRMLFLHLHDDFITQLHEYYSPSKRFYLTRELTYNSFTNIVRQICKNNDIKLTSSVRYNKSTSNIDFYIYF